MSPGSIPGVGTKTKYAGMVFNGSIGGFQPFGIGSNPIIRSKILNTIMNPLDIFIWLLDKLVTIICHTPVNYVHSRDRRKTVLYKKKQEIVKDIWTASLMIMILILQYPFFLAGVMVLSLATTFVSFAILDETQN